MNQYQRYVRLGKPVEFLMHCWANACGPEGAEKEEHGWAAAELIDDARDDPAKAWQCILCAIEMPACAEHLGVLAAGPLEDLLSFHGPEYIDRIEAKARTSPLFALVLGGVWRFQMTDSVWSRVKGVRDTTRWGGSARDD
jgi:hypothetical protein